MIMSNNINTPRLRFPEFSGEWDYVYGNELFEPISNKNHNSDLPILALTQEQGAVPRDMINYNVVVSDKSVAGYKVVEVDDFIISLRSFQGGIEYSRYKGLCSPAYIVLRKKSKDLSSDFYRIYFKSFNYIQALNKNLEGIRDGKMISYQQFSEIKLPKPSPAEQEKIAECLTEMDNLISAQAQKVDALKEKKKGLMQQLFPQPGQTTPKLRFPGFTGDWEEKKLGEVFEKVNNGANYNTYLTKGFPMSRIETISTGKIDFQRVGYSDVEPDSKYKLQVGDILFSHINSESRIGRIARYEGEQPLYHGMNLLLLRVNKNFDKKFVFYLMDREEIRKNIQKYAKKAINQASVSTADIKRVSVQLPHSPSEQQKIAEFLTALDEQIAAESAKVEALKDHKKGLMQQMFPQTGK